MVEVDAGVYVNVIFFLNEENLFEIFNFFFSFINHVSNKKIGGKFNRRKCSIFY